MKAEATLQGAEERLESRVIKIETALGHAEATLREELRAEEDAADAELAVFKAVVEQCHTQFAEAQVGLPCPLRSSHTTLCTTLWDLPL